MLITFFPKSYRLWNNVEKYGRARQATDDNIIRRMRFACWITKATDTHSEYLILIALPRQQWLCERASVSRYPFIASPVNTEHALCSDSNYTFNDVATVISPSVPAGYFYVVCATDNTSSLMLFWGWRCRKSPKRRKCVFCSANGVVGVWSR
jgi:hypothetical protein